MRIMQKFLQSKSTFLLLIQSKEADIQYNPQGDYYLIKYERDTIRAWGAINK